MPVADMSELLRTHCSQDNGVVSCTRGPKLQCQNGHDVAKNFPYDTFWNYCCDCNIVFSSLAAAGAKADANCSYCERLITRRYLCHLCKTMSYESDENESTKHFNLRTDDPPVPSCPGCL